MKKTKYPYDKLIRDFGNDIVNRAIKHFCDIERHCTFDQLKKECENIKASSKRF